MRLLKQIIALLVWAYVCQTALKREEYLSEQQFGVWTNTIQAQPEYTNLPAQYYLCGFAFQEQVRVIELRNCRCGMHWYRWRYRYQCKPCGNQFRNRAVAFAGVFCHGKRWTEQVVKNFATGSVSGGNWRDRVLCPIGYYATGFAGKFGVQHGHNLGFHGMLLTCTTTDLKNTQVVQDSQYHQSNHFQAKNSSFISAYKLKHEPGGILSGIAFYAQGMPIISNIKIVYDSSAGFDDYPVTIDSQIVSNCDKNTAQKKVGFSKSYETTGQWNSNNPEVKGYEMANNITIAAPNLGNSKDGAIGGIYKLTSGVFEFDVPVKTVITSNQEILVFVSGLTESKVSTVLQEQKGSIPYTAVITLRNKSTGELILNYTVSGTWQGVTTSSVRTDIYSTPAKCVTETPAEKQTKKGDEGTNLRSL